MGERSSRLRSTPLASSATNERRWRGWAGKAEGGAGVVAVARVSEAGHPEEAVVHRVVNAVGPVEAEADRRHAQVVEKDRVVGATADAHVDEVVVAGRWGRLLRALLLHLRSQRGEEGAARGWGGRRAGEGGLLP